VGEGGRQRAPADSLPDCGGGGAIAVDDTHSCAKPRTDTHLRTQARASTRTRTRTSADTHARTITRARTLVWVCHQPALARRAPCEVPRAPQRSIPGTTCTRGVLGVLQKYSQGTPRGTQGELGRVLHDPFRSKATIERRSAGTRQSMRAVPTRGRRGADAVPTR
jgi:hypothetical protein